MADPSALLAALDAADAEWRAKLAKTPPVPRAYAPWCPIPYQITNLSLDGERRL